MNLYRLMFLVSIVLIFASCSSNEEVTEEVEVVKTEDEATEEVDEIPDEESVPYITSFIDPINTFEAEDKDYSQTYGDAIVNFGKNHSGGKKAGWIGYNEGYVVFSIPREVEGLYRLYIHYETGEQRPMDLMVNDADLYSMDFPRLRAWGMVGVFEVDIWLESGLNTLKFYHETEYSPDIDLISFVLDEHTDPVEDSALKKEDIEYVERDIVTDTLLAGNESLVEIIADYSIEDVQVEISDRYLLDFYYKSLDNISVELYTNSRYQMINMPKSNGEVTRLSTMIYLNEGANTIRLKLKDNDKIQVEKIELTNLPAPATTWGVKVKERVIIPNNPKVPIYPWYPDGHISVLPDGNGEYMMYWAEFENYRTVGVTPMPEDHFIMQPEDPIFGERGNWDNFDNGGSWLMSVHRTNPEYLIGFYHAEDHWYPHEGNDIAWKSIGVTYSYDNGETWVEGEQIITSNTPKPDEPEWGGSGDCTVVWDEVKERWVAFYQENSLRVAVSNDENGSPGTWLKYFNNAFEEKGLEGKDSPVGGLELVPGGNPSVHFNLYLNKWVIVWHGWDPAYIYMSVSNDLLNWDEPIKIANAKNEYRRAWYPTIIGESDVYAGKYATLYFADLASDFSSREFIGQEIIFLRNEEVD